jgi:hypothetical protein
VQAKGVIYLVWRKVGVIMHCNGLETVIP